MLPAKSSPNTSKSFAKSISILKIADDGEFMDVTVLQENVTGDPPNNVDLLLLLWVNGFGISAPVLGDGDKDGTGGLSGMGSFWVNRY